MARAEIDRLKAENDELKAQGGTRAPGSGWVRSTAVVVLFVLGALLVPVAGVTVWSRNTILDTDRYVETVAPLSSEPQVIDSVATRITDAIFERSTLSLSSSSTCHLGWCLRPAPLPTRCSRQRKTWSSKPLRPISSTHSGARSMSGHRLRLSPTSRVRGLPRSRSTTDSCSSSSGPVLDAVKQSLTEQGFELASRIPSTDATVQAAGR